MTIIFSDMVEKTIEVFMDDFSLLGKSFDNCLENLKDALVSVREVLQRQSPLALIVRTTYHLI